MFFSEGETGGGSGGGGTLLSGGAGTGGGTGETGATGAAASGAATGAAAGAATGGGFTWAKEDGALNEGWLEKLPENLRGHASLKVISSLPDLAKSYVETKALIGKKLEMPGEGATPEQIAAWRKTVGAPEKPEGYLGEAKSLRPEAVPENLWNAEGEKKFLALAHKHSLTPAAVKEILAFHGETVAGELQASSAKETEVLKAEGTKLQQAWGKEFDANLNMASRMAQTVGLDPKTHPIFTSAEVVQAFAKMGKLISEDKLVKGDTTGVNGSIRDKVRDITDPASASPLAREYRGEFGLERQMAAQTQLHQLMATAT